MQREQVLTFPANLFGDDVWGDFVAHNGVISDPLKVWNYSQTILNSGKLSYMDREAAEKDPLHKQVIPYVVLMDADNGSLFVYQRGVKGGEDRLHGKWSIGVGGHVNPEDGDGNSREAYWRAFYRELYEETGLNEPSVNAPIDGLIYDPSNEVGKVHFGIIHFIEVRPEWLTKLSPALANGHFEANPDKMEVEWENWTKLIIGEALKMGNTNKGA